MHIDKIKSIPYITIAIITIIIISFVIINQQNEKKHPSPTNTIILNNGEEKKDESKEHEERKKWIELIHKCGPNVNWRAIDYRTRLEKAKNNLNKNKSNTVSIGGGALVGSWREIGSNNLAGRTHLVELDTIQDSIYCASSGGQIWKADKSGNNWRVLNDNFKIEDIKMIRKINNGTGTRLLVASGGWGTDNFYYSDDDGTSWNPSSGLTNISSWGYVSRGIVANDANNTIYLLALEWDYTNWYKITTLYFSTDKGATFSPIASFDEPTYGSESNFDIWTDYYGSGTVYFMENNNIHYLDTSHNPVLISSVPYSTSDGIILSGSENGGNTYLYVGVYGNGNIDFYQSTNGGINWTLKGSVAEDPFMKNSFTCSVINPQYLYYGGVECYRSHNGGQTWTKLNNWWDYYSDMDNMLHADIPGINSFMDNGNELVYINTDGGTYTSTDALNNVQNISLNDLNIGQYYSTYTHRTNSDNIFIGSQDQGYQLSSNVGTQGTIDFVQIISGDYGHIVSANGGDGVWMNYPGFACYYPAATTNQYFYNDWSFTCSGQYWIPPLMEDPNDPDKVYLGGGSTTIGSHIFHLTYNGSGTLAANELSYDFSGSAGDAPISAMEYSPINTNYRYIINGNGEFYTSTDGGNNWNMTTGFNGPGGNYLYGSAIVPSPITIGTLYVAGSGYSNPPVFMSTDNGLNFTAIDNGIPNTMIYEMTASPDGKFLFAATDVGPYVYIVANNQWYDLAAASAPDQTYWTVDYVPAIETVRFGTYGRGVWDFEIDNSTDIYNHADISSQVNIYPNPATDQINLKSEYDIIQSATIYTLSGEIVQIQDFYISSRKQTINISHLNTGIYIIHIKTHNNILDQKLIVE
jgi:hypothetical protein